MAPLCFETGGGFHVTLMLFLLTGWPVTAWGAALGTF